MNPRKPTALKILNGSAAHDPQRLNPDEPQLTALTAIPAPPAYVPLDDCARKVWDDLAARAITLGVLTEADLPMLASVCRDFAEYETARSGDGSAWRRADAAKRRYDSGLRAFGLSPSDRSRVHTIPKRNDDLMTALLAPKGRTG
jgi:phage terminase small subunit